MASKTIAEIQALLVAKIAALVDGDDNPIFKVTSPYYDASFAGYPAACIAPTAGHGAPIDTALNERYFTFEIALYQEQSKQATKKAQAAAKLTEACDAVIKAFDIDTNLGGEVMIVQVLSYTFDFKSTTGQWNFATFTVDVRQLVQHF